MIKRLKCNKCGYVNAINKLKDNRFYCPICNKNLGVYNTTRVTCACGKHLKSSKIYEKKFKKFIEDLQKGLNKIKIKGVEKNERNV